MRTNRPYVQIDPDVLERVRQIDLLSYLREFEPSNLVIPFAVLAFLIACPIGVKSKSKSLFLVSINSPPCICKMLLLYFTEM